MTDLFTQQELHDLLARGEGQFHELKSLWDLDTGSPRPRDRRSVRDDIAETVAAFANADGGTLILGVDDDGSPSGHGYPEEAIEGFIQSPGNRLRPPVHVKVQRIRLNGNELIVMQIGIAPEAVMIDGNGFPY